MDMNVDTRPQVQTVIEAVQLQLMISVTREEPPFQIDDALATVIEGLKEAFPGAEVAVAIIEAIGAVDEDPEAPAQASAWPAALLQAPCTIATEDLED